jgi:hypothetical protein
VLTETLERHPQAVVEGDRVKNTPSVHAEPLLGIVKPVRLGPLVEA